jgi:hypothetical protein
MLTGAREPLMLLLSKWNFSKTLLPGDKKATLQSHYKYYRVYTIYDSKMSTKLKCSQNLDKFM